MSNHRKWLYPEGPHAWPTRRPSNFVLSVSIAQSPGRDRDNDTITEVVTQHHSARPSTCDIHHPPERINGLWTRPSRREKLIRHIPPLAPEDGWSGHSSVGLSDSGAVKLTTQATLVHSAEETKGVRMANSWPQERRLTDNTASAVACWTFVADQKQSFSRH